MGYLPDFWLVDWGMDPVDRNGSSTVIPGNQECYESQNDCVVWRIARAGRL